MITAGKSTIRPPKHSVILRRTNRRIQKLQSLLDRIAALEAKLATGA